MFYYEDGEQIYLGQHYRDPMNEVWEVIDIIGNKIKSCCVTGMYYGLGTIKTNFIKDDGVLPYAVLLQADELCKEDLVA